MNGMTQKSVLIASGVIAIGLLLGCFIVLTLSRSGSFGGSRNNVVIVVDEEGEVHQTKGLDDDQVAELIEDIEKIEAAERALKEESGEAE